MSTKDSHPQGLSCSFCGKRRSEVHSLIAGPTVYICGECIKLCNDILAEESKPEEKRRPVARDPEWESYLEQLRQQLGWDAVKAKSSDRHHHGNLSCSFCGKGQREVRKLIAAPTIYICDECVNACNDIIAQESAR